MPNAGIESPPREKLKVPPKAGWGADTITPEFMSSTGFDDASNRPRSMTRPQTATHGQTAIHDQTRPHEFADNFNMIVMAQPYITHL